jgi:hypothetical protein
MRVSARELLLRRALPSMAAVLSLLMLASCANCYSRDEVGEALLVALLIALVVLEACYNSGSGS